MGSDNGLVPPGTKPLPEPMLIQIYDNLVQFPKATMSSFGNIGVPDDTLN